MSLYLKIPIITGNVTAKGHQGWIELFAMTLGATRPIIQQVGTAQIHRCRTDKTLAPYMKYELSNVMISNYQEITSIEGDPQELLTLSFTQLQRSYVPCNAERQSQAPLIMGYNLETAQLT